MSGELSPSEVATLIEKGLCLVGTLTDNGRSISIEECHNRYLDVDLLHGEKYLACALGLAIIGMYDSPVLAYQEWYSKLGKTHVKGSDIAAKILGMSPLLAEKLDVAHQGGIRATELVRKLRLQAVVIRTGYF